MALSEAAKCALIPMDSTTRSNLTVGRPLDLVIVHRDEFPVASHVAIGPDDGYFQMFRGACGEARREAFSELANPDWLGAR
jgi:putative proteasome-type protease